MKRGIFLFLISYQTLFAVTAEEIVKIVDSKRGPSSSFVMMMRVTSYKDEEVQESLEMKGYVKGNKSMVIFTAPSQWKGRKMLMIENDVVMIFPNTSRPVRLSPSQRLMGDVANGDVARLSFSLDYEASLQAEESWNGASCYVLKLKARKIGTTYHTITLYVDKENMMPLKAHFFSTSGKELKVAFYSQPRLLAGSERISKITLRDSITTNRYSVIEFLSMEEQAVPDKYFNVDFLMEM